MTLLPDRSFPEKRCARCGEYWPADGEFFRPDNRRDHPRLHAWCRACEAEQKAEHRRGNAK